MSDGAAQPGPGEGRPDVHPFHADGAGGVMVRGPVERGVQMGLKAAVSPHRAVLLFFTQEIATILKFNKMGSDANL